MSIRDSNAQEMLYPVLLHTAHRSLLCCYFAVCAFICLALFDTFVTHLSGTWSNPDFMWGQHL